MSYFESLQMTKEQEKVFNCGFVNLPVSDTLILMNMSDSEFNDKFKIYYEKGMSYHNFEVLKRLYELSNSSLENLSLYSEKRGLGIFNVKEMAPNQDNPPISTAELIRKLKRQLE